MFRTVPLFATHLLFIFVYVVPVRLRIIQATRHDYKRSTIILN